MMSLLDLHFELDRRGIPVVLGGGFGLYLKRRHLVTTGARTLFDRLPQPRATNDLDLFLRAEVLADPARAAAVADAIRCLGYEAILGAELYQWKRKQRVGEIPREVKLDLLVGPVGALRAKLQGDRRRLRPRGRSVGNHAHPTEEAIGLEDDPLAISVEGKRSDGAPHRATVFIPQTFPFLMMKLHAFDDRKDDAAKEQGRHHALDVFTIVGTMTEEEYEGALRTGRSLYGEGHVARSRHIVRESFSTATAPGIIRLREHPLFQPDFALGEFIVVLGEIFPEAKSNAVQASDD